MLPQTPTPNFESTTTIDEFIHHFLIIKNNADGNCLFESICFSLPFIKPGRENTTQSLRNKLHEYYKIIMNTAIYKNEKEPKDELMQKIHLGIRYDNIDEDGREHHEEIKKDRIWASMTDILILGFILKIDMLLITMGNNCMNIRNMTNLGQAQGFILLYYSGENHFEAVAKKLAPGETINADYPCPHITVSPDPTTQEELPPTVRRRRHTQEEIPAEIHPPKKHAPKIDIFATNTAKAIELPDTIVKHLHPNIQHENLEWNAICANPAAAKHLHDIEPGWLNPDELFRNTDPAAIPLIAQKIQSHSRRPSYIQIHELCKNTNPGISQILHLLSPIPSHERKTLSRNPAAAEFLLQNLNMIDYTDIYLMEDPAMLNHLFEFHDPNPTARQVWSNLSANRYATPLLLAHPHKIDMANFCKNRDPRAMEYIAAKLLEKPDDPQISGYILSSNPAAINILREHPKKIVWPELLSNPAAADMIEARANQYGEIWTSDTWNIVCRNPAAIRVVLDHADKLKLENWVELSRNPGIFAAVAQ